MTHPPDPLDHCPFCGKVPTMKRAVGEYWPLCACGVSGTASSTERGAIEAWNGRVGDGDQADAHKWRALVGCARIRVMGSAGFGYGDKPPDADGYRHIDLEVWTRFVPAAEFVGLVDRDRLDAVQTLEKFVGLVKL